MAVPERRSRGKIAIAMAVALTVAIVCFLITSAVLTHGYIVLLPDRSDEEATIGLVIGVIASICALATLLHFRPKLSSPAFISYPMLGFCALLLGFLLGMSLATDAFDLSDFSGRPLVRFDGFLRVSRFYQSHGKGTRYHAQLADFGPRLDLYWDDYRWNAGDSEDLLVVGKCIRVHFGRSGRALRFVQPEHVRAVPCPDPSRIVGAAGLLTSPPSSPRT